MGAALWSWFLVVIVAKYTLWIPSNNTHLANFYIYSYASILSKLAMHLSAVVHTCPLLAPFWAKTLQCLSISHNTAKRCKAQGEGLNVFLEDHACSSRAE
jgi:hypothetical protein